MPPVASDLLPMVVDALDTSDGVLAVLQRGSDAAATLTVLQVNDAFCRAFAADSATLEGQPFAALTAAEEGEKLRALIAAAARGEPYRTELVCVRPNGTRLWLGLHLMPARQPGHASGLFVMLARDISGPRREREQQNAVQRMLATVFSAAEAGLAIVGPDGRFLMVNGYLARLFGYEQAALAGQLTLDHIAPESRDAVRAARAQQQVDLQRYTLDAAVLTSDGSQVPVTLVAAMVPQNDREQYRVITVTARGPGVRVTGPLNVRLSGKIRLVSLEEVKAALGLRWAGMVERVMESAERIVARQMIPGDTFFRTKDHGFVVCFPSATEDEATFRAAALAREIRQRLIGAGEDAATVEISAVVAPMPSSLREPSNAALESHMADVEQHLCDEAKPPPDAFRFVVERVIGREQGPVLGQFVSVPPPPRGRAGGVVALPPDRLETDLAKLRFAERMTLDRPGGAEALFFEIDFDCFFSRPKTQALIDALQSLAPAARERIVVMLAGLTESVAQSRVLDSTQRLRPHCRAVGFVIDVPELRGVDGIVTAGTFVLLNAHFWDRSKALVNARVTKLASGLHSRKTSLMVRGVESVAGRDVLRDCGVNLFVVANAPA